MIDSYIELVAVPKDHIEENKVYIKRIRHMGGLILSLLTLAMRKILPFA